jgi:hypothetical protein
MPSPGHSSYPKTLVCADQRLFLFDRFDLRASEQVISHTI